MKKRPTYNRIKGLLAVVAICVAFACAIVGCGRDAGEETSTSERVPSVTRPPKPTATPEPPWWEAEEYQDFIAAGSSRFINKADSYYYYEQISDDARRIYDGMLAVMRDPTTTKYHKRVEVRVRPGSDEFVDEMSRAREALVYDHPEMFWLRESRGFNCYYNPDAEARLPNGSYLAMIELLEPYGTCQEDMKTFYDAANAILGAADLSQPQPLLALELHDLLIDQVSYDDALGEASILTQQIGEGEEMEETGEISEDEALTDRGHTAYGAFVENSRGEANRAVCDGYAYALQYLWQQAGIMCAVINGTAGDTDGALELHAWNALALDGEWYEVDATWNDAALQDVLEKDLSDENNAIYAMALEDPGFTEPIRHYMYGLTTERITNYVPDELFRYETDYEYVEIDLGSSVHIRTTEEEAELYDETVSLLSPVAEGTTYQYDQLIAWLEGSWSPETEATEEEAA